MPADPASPIPAALTHLTHTNLLQLKDPEAGMVDIDRLSGDDLRHRDPRFGGVAGAPNR